MIGETLKLLRLKACRSQKEVAADLGIPRQTMNQYECDKLNPSQSRLRQLADYYGVSTGYIMGDAQNECQANELSVEDNMLLTKFRKLSTEGKLQILMQIDFLLYGGITTNVK